MSSEIVHDEVEEVVCYDCYSEDLLDFECGDYGALEAIERAEGLDRILRVLKLAGEGRVKILISPRETWRILLKHHEGGFLDKAGCILGLILLKG